MRTMRDTDLDFEKPTKTVRFTDDERDRLREVMKRVRSRNRSAAQMADPSKLIKELMGLADFGLITQEDRDYLAGVAPLVPSSGPQKVGCVFCGKLARDGLCPACRGELTKSPRIAQDKLDNLPYGAIELNEQGTIIAYNKAETEMSRISHKKAVGKNFFTLAPCADIQEFHGRYDAFLRGTKPSEKFNFTYEFPHDTVKVTLTFMRLDSRRVLVTAQKALTTTRQKRA